MADSNSPATGAITIFDVASDLSTANDSLRILVDLANSTACDWSATDDAQTVGRLLERIMVLTNCSMDKIRATEELVEQLHRIDFESKRHEATA